jgi:hypothetical protein
MNRISKTTILLIILAALLGTALLLHRFAGRSAPAQGNALRTEGPSTASIPAMQDVQIIDATGFGRPMVSATTQIPSGWATQGGVGWDRSSDCVTNHLRFRWLAVSPDGEQVFEAMPGYNWQVQGTEIQMNPCPAMATRSVREFLQAIGQRYPAAQVIEYRGRADLLPRNPAAPLNGARAHSEAGQLVIGFQSGGREMRALLTTTLNFSELQGNVVVGTSAVYAQYAPKGKLNGLIGEHIMKSLQIDQRWLAAANQTMKAAIDRIGERQRQGIAAWHSQRMAQINARGAMDRSQIRMQANREVAQIYSNTWADSMATDDRIQRRTLESIGGYNTYADPAGGGTVRSGIEYERVIRTGNGDYIPTNDPYLNPAGSQELERIP